MTIDAAKRIPLVGLLRRLGHEPVRSFKGGAEVAFRSPLRAEREPSFFVNVPKNAWFDFGAGQGGGVIELIQILEKTDLRGALVFLKNGFGAADFDFPKIEFEKKLVADDGEESLRITEIKPFGTTRSLADYITRTRRIAPETAARHLREIHFLPVGRVGESGPKKAFFAAGFGNLAGGWELRNAFFKGSVGGKDLSLVRGKTSATASVFEGFMDFLTVQTAFALDEPTTDAIILNSVSHLERAALLAHKNGYSSLRIWLDNDAAGKTALARLIDLAPCSVEPQNHRYFGFKDVNEAFLKTGKIL